MIRIVCVGKLKESYWRYAVMEYVKRINRYHKIDIIELEDSKVELEEKLILNHINKLDYNILLDIDGESVNSLDLAKKIDKTFINYSCITFIVGGSCGVSDRIKEIVNYRLSFSKLTFPHQLFRVILLEQIYRCFKINNNETYHK